MSFCLSDLIEKHVPTLKNRGHDLCRLLNEDPQKIDEIKALSHLLSGSSGSLGFRTYHELTSQIESICKINGTEAKIPTELAHEFFHCVNELAPKKSSLYTKRPENA